MSSCRTSFTCEDETESKLRSGRPTYSPSVTGSAPDGPFTKSVPRQDLSDLQAELLVKNRSDNRIGTALRWLEVLGILEGDFETHDLRVVRELYPAMLPASVGSPEKLRRDLEALLAMVHFSARPEACRRQTIAVHFGLPPPVAPCGACDVCSDAAGWRTERLAPRQNAPAESSGEPGWARGQWVRVGGRLGRIVRVEGEGKRVKLFVESADDLEVRAVDPRRARPVQ